ncbi:hypothetical protein AB0D08_01190 [Kitasatospora sp. NPDC048540]|uniref:hypothetical protein n=1 Tax=unclassified Kitasatospora TaxID=2633591 RepID=UPI000539D73F|nr:hypothetical protein [Kitasatospora sp. MBT63]
MVWTWRFEKEDGSQVAASGAEEEFSSQGDAESWIGESWKDLLEGGADRAVLRDDDRVIYSMSLHEG